ERANRRPTGHRGPGGAGHRSAPGREHRAGRAGGRPGRPGGPAALLRGRLPAHPPAGAGTGRAAPPAGPAVAGAGGRRGANPAAGHREPGPARRGGPHPPGRVRRRGHRVRRGQPLGHPARAAGLPLRGRARRGRAGAGGGRGGRRPGPGAHRARGQGAGVGGRGDPAPGPRRLPGQAEVLVLAALGDRTAAPLRGDAQDLPELDLDRLAGMDRKELAEALELHDDEFEQRRLEEERRLLYVAVTRAERALLLSAHWWSESGGKPKGPSDFFVELAEAARETGGGIFARWAPEPSEEAENPLAEAVRSAQWPVDPLGARRDAVAEGADLVRSAMSTAQEWETAEDDQDEWARDVDVLLAERAAA